MTDDLVKAKVQDVLSKGQSFEYILECWQHRHFGAVKVGKALLITVPNGSMLNCQGTHVQVSGDPGSGKSNAVQEMAALIPPKWMLSGATTPQALFYPIESFVDGSINFQDDIVWGSALGVSVKRITSNFQDGAERIVTTDSVGIKQRSRKRIVFWVTSVDNQADEQVRDRFILVESDGSKEHLSHSIKLMQSRDAGKDITPKDKQFEMEVCHGLVNHLREFEGSVVVPFAEQINFSGGPRAYRIFIDIVKSFAMFDRDHRMLDDKGRLEATFDDYHKGLKLYKELKGHSSSRYTKTEEKVLCGIVDSGYRCGRAQLQKATGLSSGRLGDIMNGRNREDQQGLLHKCPELSADGYPIIYSLDRSWSPDSYCDIELVLVT